MKIKNPKYMKCKPFMIDTCTSDIRQNISHVHMIAAKTLNAKTEIGHTCSFKDMMEFSILSEGGGSMNRNFLASGSPIAIICSRSESRGTRCISGVE